MLMNDLQQWRKRTENKTHENDLISVHRAMICILLYNRLCKISLCIHICIRTDNRSLGFTGIGAVREFTKFDIMQLLPIGDADRWT